MRYEEVQLQNRQLAMISQGTMMAVKDLKNSFDDIQNSIRLLATRANEDEFGTSTKRMKKQDMEMKVLNGYKDSEISINGFGPNIHSPETNFNHLSKLPKKISHSGDSSSSLKSKTSKRKIQKIRDENNSRKAVTKEMMEIPPIEKPAREQEDNSEDEFPEVDEWSLPHPPQEVVDFRRNLATIERETWICYPSEEEMKSNLFFSLTGHCTEHLPHWIKDVFVENALERFEEIYLESDERSTIFEEKAIYPDTEPLEAATEEKLRDFCYPIICRAIVEASDDLYVNVNFFSTYTSKWISISEELDKFSSGILDGNLSSVSEEAEADEQE